MPGISRPGISTLLRGFSETVHELRNTEQADPFHCPCQELTAYVHSRDVGAIPMCSYTPLSLDALADHLLSASDGLRAIRCPVCGKLPILTLNNSAVELLCKRCRHVILVELIPLLQARATS